MRMTIYIFYVSFEIYLDIILIEILPSIIIS